MDLILAHTFPVSVSLAQVGFSGSIFPQDPSGNSLMVKEDLPSAKACLAVGSSAVK